MKELNFSVGRTVRHRKILGFVCLIAAFGGFGLLATGTGEPCRAAAQKQTTAGRHFALIIATGKSAVPPSKPLLAPQNDAVLMAHLLAKRFGFAPPLIRIIGLEDAGQKQLRPFGNFDFREAAADRQAIDAGFAWLKKTVKSAQDSVVVYYSGHGASILANNKAEIANDGGNDEALVPDGMPTPDDFIRDNEIAALFRDLPTANITFVADCCMSGGLLQAGSEVNKTEPTYLLEGKKNWRVGTPDMMGVIARGPAFKATWNDIQRGKGSFLAACLFDEAAATRYWEGHRMPFSPFTLALCRVLWRTPGNVTWNQLRDTADKRRVTPEITRLTALLGGTQQTPMLRQGKGTADVFVTPTPDYRPNRIAMYFRRQRQLAPLGWFVLKGVKQPNASVPASLPWRYSSLKPRDHFSAK